MGFLSRLIGSGARPRDLLTDVSEDYRAEVEQAALLRAQAERARYPQAAEELRRLAEVEDRHAGWLRDHLSALGGRPPDVTAPRVAGSNQWERAVGAYKAAQMKRRRLIEQIVHWDPDQPETVSLLQRIEQEDTREQRAYEGLIMRSDPQSLD
jgi:rubrerythrin